MLNKIKQFLNNNILIAGFWSLGSHGLNSLIRLASNLIMTRLLVPEMFGIMVIANLLMVGLALFTDLGTELNIIRSKRGYEPVFQNTVWVIQILRGFIIWFIGLIIAGSLYIANANGYLEGNTVYNEPILPFVIAAISFTAVVSGFQSTRMAITRRELKLKPIFYIELYSQLITVATMVIWAMIDRSIWALVSGVIVGRLATVAFSYILIDGIPNRWQWDKSAFSEVFHFGKWVFVSSIIGFLFVNGDRLILGGMLSAEMLGIYSIAYIMVTIVLEIYHKMRSAVLFPAFSNVFRDNPSQLKDQYYKFRIWFDASALFIVGFLYMVSELIITVLYDSRYSEAGAILQILSFIVIAQRYDVTDQVYLAIGKPKLHSSQVAIRVIALYVSVPLGFHFYGLNGALWAIVFSYISSVPYSIYLKSKNDLLDFKKELITIPFFPIGIIAGKLLLLLITAFVDIEAFK